MDHILAVDDRSFYLKGWVHDEDAEIVRLTAVSPEGAGPSSRDKLFRYPRPDVVECRTLRPQQRTGRARA